MADERLSHFQVGQDQGCRIITACGPEIEFESKDELYALADAGELELRQVVLNLKHIVTVKSAILGVLIQFQRKVEAAGGRLKVVCPDPDILRMFHITNVDRIFDLYKGVQIAIDAFTDNTWQCVATAGTLTTIARVRASQGLRTAGYGTRSMF
jgi:anti-anti-sigma factor